MGHSWLKNFTEVFYVIEGIYKNKHNDMDANQRKLLIGLTLSGDGDLAHLSEGISNDLGYLYMDFTADE